VAARLRVPPHVEAPSRRGGSESRLIHTHRLERLSAKCLVIASHMGKQSNQTSLCFTVLGVNTYFLSKTAFLSSCFGQEIRVDP